MPHEVNPLLLGVATVWADGDAAAVHGSRAGCGQWYDHRLYRQLDSLPGRWTSPDPYLGSAVWLQQASELCERFVVHGGAGGAALPRAGVDSVWGRFSWPPYSGEMSLPGENLAAGPAHSTERHTCCMASRGGGNLMKPQGVRL